MSALSEYNPLKSILLPDVEISEPQGIVVVVGPNSSGKSLLLRDIEGYLRTGKPDFVVCQDIVTRRPANFQELWDDLLKLRYLQLAPGQTKLYRTYVPFFNADQRQQSKKRITFERQQLEKCFQKTTEGQSASNEEWFGLIGTTLVALLSLDERRNICCQSPSFNYKDATPDAPVQGLVVNTEAQDRLATETSRVFGRPVWLDTSEPALVKLRVSHTSELPSHGEMSNPFSAAKYPQIESEGDGIRSYAGICISLLLATRPVSLIDEPELCLHPPQAYHIGRFIGKYAKPEHVTVVATHSSHILRGILDTGEKVTVVRLSKVRQRFKAQHVAEKELVDNLRNPRTRAESILDGVFSKGVILLEAEGDREEYQAAAEAIDDYPSREVHMVPVGGTGGFAEPLRFFQALNIPTAIIADLDAVCDLDKMVALVQQRAPDRAAEINAKVKRVVALIKGLPPSITEEGATQCLQELAAGKWSWAGGGDNALRRKLNDLEGKLKRIQRVKEGGVDAYNDHPAIKQELIETIDSLASIGIFLVPVGELEDWVAQLVSAIPKNSLSKSERAAKAAILIREAQDKSGDIWEFVRKVFDYLGRTSATVSH